MEFYDATLAKQYARNKTRIIKEINDIEETIADAVDNGQFSCDVYNTIMTDDREMAEPSVPAEAHCIMELNTVKIESYNCGYNHLLESVDGMYSSTVDDEYEDNIDGGDADDGYYVYNEDGDYWIYNADGGRADGEIHRPDNFRVGEVLVIQGHEHDINPMEFIVKEINEYGEVIDLDIVSRGEYSDEIFDEATLTYKEFESKWLDIDSDFGQLSDLKIDRDGQIYVKDFRDITSGNQYVVNEWEQIGQTYRLGTLPPDYFGNFGDLYIEDGSSMYVKDSNGKWVKRNEVYHYSKYVRPSLDLGTIGTLYTNVFGKNWVKTKCGWELVKHVYELGDLYTKPNINDYEDGDIVIYNRINLGKDFSIKSTVRTVLYKDCCCSWLHISSEHDWSNVPAPEFGNLLDLFIYPNNVLVVKVEHEVSGKFVEEWVVVDDAYRFDSMYLNDNFGKIHDVIVYSGEYEPMTTWVKMRDFKNPNKGHWTRVEKVWNMDDYLLGRIPISISLTWNVKSIILDKKGNGYVYEPLVKFNNGSATAIAKTVADKVTEIILINGGGDYTDEIPTINIAMNEKALSQDYYQVWKRRLENDVLQDEMEQVINYFDKTKIYTVSRVTNSNGKTFHWHVSWN